MNRIALCMWERRCFTQVFMRWRLTINRPIKIDSVGLLHVLTNRYQAGAGSNEQHAFKHGDCLEQRDKGRKEVKR